MSEYTPTTEAVLISYVGTYPALARLASQKERLAEFDRWLAQVKAEVWDEGFTYGHYTPGEPKECDCRVNPYRAERTTS